MPEKIRTDVPGVRASVARSAPTGLESLTSALRGASALAENKLKKKQDELEVEAFRRLKADPSLTPEELAQEGLKWRLMPRKFLKTIGNKRDAEFHANTAIANMSRTLVHIPDGDPEAMNQAFTKAYAANVDDKPDLFADVDSRAVFDDKWSVFIGQRLSASAANAQRREEERVSEVTGRALFAEIQASIGNGDANFQNVVQNMQTVQRLDSMLAPQLADHNQSVMTRTLISTSQDMGSAGLRLLRVGEEAISDPDRKNELRNARRALAAELDAAAEKDAINGPKFLKARRSELWQQGAALRERGNATDDEIANLVSELELTADGPSIVNELKSFRSFMTGDMSGRPEEPNLALRAKWERSIQLGERTIEQAYGPQGAALAGADLLALNSVKTNTLLSSPGVPALLRLYEKDAAAISKGRRQRNLSDSAEVSSLIIQDLVAYSGTQEGRELTASGDAGRILSVVRGRAANVAETFAKAAESAPPEVRTGDRNRVQLQAARRAAIQENIEREREKVRVERQRHGLGVGVDDSPYTVAPSRLDAPELP